MPAEPINIDNIPRRRAFIDATIPNGASVSNAVDIKGLHIVALRRPATTGITTISFEVSDDGITWYPMVDAANVAISLVLDNVAAMQRLSSLVDLLGGDHVRLKAGANVVGNQTLRFVLANLS